MGRLRTISFPHSLCMHAIICTADDKVLLTKRSKKVSYYPGAWSCSLEEQITPDDLLGKESVVLSWARRMLDEELGLQPNELNPNNLRVMSIFLESDIMNISLCAHISLNLDSPELDRRLRLLPRKDNEFSEWQFMTHRELIDELRSPTNTHHASTGYRIVFALIKRFGEDPSPRRFRELKPNKSLNRTFCGMRQLGFISFWPNCLMSQNAG